MTSRVHGLTLSFAHSFSRCSSTPTPDWTPWITACLAELRLEHPSLWMQEMSMRRLRREQHCTTCYFRIFLWISRSSVAVRMRRHPEANSAPTRLTSVIFGPRKGRLDNCRTGDRRSIFRMARQCRHSGLKWYIRYPVWVQRSHRQSRFSHQQPMQAPLEVQNPMSPISVRDLFQKDLLTMLDRPEVPVARPRLPGTGIITRPRRSSPPLELLQRWLKAPMRQQKPNTKIRYCLRYRLCVRGMS